MSSSVVVSEERKPIQRVEVKSKGILIVLKNTFAKMEPYLYLLPALFIFALFVYYPFMKTGYMSLFLTNVRGDLVEYVGLDNFKQLFQSPDFLASIIVTLKFVLMTAIPSIIIGTILALAVQKKGKGISIVRTLYALPMAVSSSCAAVIWILLFHPTIGFINKLFHLQIGWLSDAKWALLAVSLVTIWMGIGMTFIFVLAGLQNIPRDYYESAAIDGAGYFRVLFQITIPLLSPTLFFVTVISVIGSFQVFGQIHLMKAGGPGNSTTILAYSIYQEAFINNRFGTSSAISLVLFVITFVITLIQFRYEKKLVHYQ